MYLENSCNFDGPKNNEFWFSSASSKNENRRYYQEELSVPVKWIGGSDATFSTFQQRSDKHALCTESLQNQID